MPKIDRDELTSRDKKRLNIWTKQRIIIEIGEAYYEVEPQPAAAILEFQDLLALYTEYATQFKDRSIEDVGAEDLRGLVQTFVKSPYPLLRPFVPDLEKEDAKAAPWGQVWHNISILAEINGLGWGEKLLKEFVVPFVPDFLRSLQTLGEGTVRARGLIGKSGSEKETSSSTSSPESPTASTPQEP